MSKNDYYRCSQCGNQAGYGLCGNHCCPLGIIGPQGPKGDRGLQGETGPQGVQGIPGPAGLQGPTGAAGADGNSVRILGSYASVEELEAAHPTGDIGDSYLVGGHLYVWDAIANTWRDVGKIQGPDGPTGRQGIPGVQGDMGHTGPEGPRGIQGDRGVQGEIGPTGPQGLQGPVAAAIPFSISKYGVQLSTDAQGQPYAVGFSGFSSSYYSPDYLQEGEWASGKITILEDMGYSTAFIVPYNAKLRNIYVLFSLEEPKRVEEDVTIKPFVCIVTSNSETLEFDIREETLVFADPYTGGVEYPKHTIRRGEVTGLDMDLPAGTLVAIVLGMMAEGNLADSQSAMFSASGGIYLQ